MDLNGSVFMGPNNTYEWTYYIKGHYAVLCDLGSKDVYKIHFRNLVPHKWKGCRYNRYNHNYLTGLITAKDVETYIDAVIIGNIVEEMGG